MRKLLLPCFLLMASFPAISQEINLSKPSTSTLYIPREIQQAYENETRSMTGEPGVDYWQNRAKYTIEAQIDPQAKVVSGEAAITYYNESPDNLSIILIRLLYDVYKKGNPRDEVLNPNLITDGVDIRYLVVAGDTLALTNNFNVTRRGTNLSVRLSDGLASGDSLTLSMGWSLPIPPANGRTGSYDETSLFVGYWYPQIAVYDDIFGWDDLDHRGLMEYYSDIADYDVKITAPTTYNLWATGTLQNPEEIFPDSLLARYQEAQESEEVIPIISEEMANEGFEMKSGTWHYVAHKVPDFAFAVSDHFIWEGSSLEVEEGRRVFIGTAYPPQNKDSYELITEYQRNIMDYFSKEIPGIPYPYEAYISINMSNGGGMEFPMMANNGSYPQLVPLLSLTAHEMHHTYFPFYVRINEKRFAWMDEGWADYITDLCLGRAIVDPAYEAYATQNLGSYMGQLLGTFNNLPLMTDSESLSEDNYYGATYQFAHYSYYMLHSLIGEEKFVTAFKEYIKRWAYKNPTPYDFFFTFQDVLGEDLDWFWKAWYLDFGYPDLAIRKIEKGKVTIENKGQKPVPVELQVTYADGNSDTLEQSLGVWKDNRSIEMELSTDKQVKTLLLNRAYADAFPENNTYRASTVDPNTIPWVAYGGEYQFEGTDFLRIESNQPVLKASIFLFGFTETMYPDGDHRFSNIDGNLSLEFELSEEKLEGSEGGSITRASSVTINFMGSERKLERKKEE